MRLGSWAITVVSPSYEAGIHSWLRDTHIQHILSQQFSASMHKTAPRQQLQHKP